MNSPNSQASVSMSRGSTDSDEDNADDELGRAEQEHTQRRQQAQQQRLSLTLNAASPRLNRTCSNTYTSSLKPNDSESIHPDTNPNNPNSPDDPNNPNNPAAKSLLQSHGKMSKVPRKQSKYAVDKKKFLLKDHPDPTLAIYGVQHAEQEALNESAGLDTGRSGRLELKNAEEEDEEDSGTSGEGVDAEGETEIEECQVTRVEAEFHQRRRLSAQARLDLKESITADRPIPAHVRKALSSLGALDIETLPESTSSRHNGSGGGRQLRGTCLKGNDSNHVLVHIDPNKFLLKD